MAVFRPTQQYDVAGLVSDPPPYDVSICDILLDDTNLNFTLDFVFGANMPTLDNPVQDVQIKIFAQMDPKSDSETLLATKNFDQITAPAMSVALGIDESLGDPNEIYPFRFEVEAKDPQMDPIEFHPSPINPFDFELVADTV